MALTSPIVRLFGRKLGALRQQLKAFLLAQVASQNGRDHRGNKADFTSGYPNLADRVAIYKITRRGRAPQPPASARPWTAAITGAFRGADQDTNKGRKRACVLKVFFIPRPGNLLQRRKVSARTKIAAVPRIMTARVFSSFPASTNAFASDLIKSHSASYAFPVDFSVSRLIAPPLFSTDSSAIVSGRFYYLCQHLEYLNLSASTDPIPLTDRAGKMNQLQPVFGLRSLAEKA